MRKKLPSSVIGVDLGRHSIKTVALQRKGGNRYVISNYGVHVMAGAPLTPDQLTYELKQALKEVGASAKSCAVAVSSTDSLIRIIEQPETPRDVLRDAIRLNGLSLLNQDVKEFVLDCEPISLPSNVKAPKPEKKKKGEAPAPVVPAQQVKYLVAGLPRSRVQFIDQAFQQYKKTTIHNMQLSLIHI